MQFETMVSFAGKGCRSVALGLLWYLSTLSLRGSIGGSVDSPSSIVCTPHFPSVVLSSMGVGVTLNLCGAYLGAWTTYCSMYTLLQFWWFVMGVVVSLRCNILGLLAFLLGGGCLNGLLLLTLCMEVVVAFMAPFLALLTFGVAWRFPALFLLVDWASYLSVSLKVFVTDLCMDIPGFWVEGQGGYLQPGVPSLGMVIEFCWFHMLACGVVVWCMPLDPFVLDVFVWCLFKLQWFLWTPAGLGNLEFLGHFLQCPSRDHLAVNAFCVKMDCMGDSSFMDLVEPCGWLLVFCCDFDDGACFGFRW